MSKEKLKEAFDAGYDYRSSLLPEVIKEFGENSASTFEEWYTEQKLLQHGIMQAEGSAVSEGAAVGQRSVGQNVSDWLCDCTDKCEGTHDKHCQYKPLK